MIFNIYIPLENKITNKLFVKEEFHTFYSALFPCYLKPTDRGVALFGICRLF